MELYIQSQKLSYTDKHSCTLAFIMKASHMILVFFSHTISSGGTGPGFMLLADLGDVLSLLQRTHSVLSGETIATVKPGNLSKQVMHL